MENAAAKREELRPRGNNFGLIRVVLASLVVLSHAPELMDGDRHREILTHLFGTLSFGELAVDGFFLVSGFLIVKSWEGRPELRKYLEKRVLRIYPGFVVASLLSVLLVGRLAASAPVSVRSLVRPTVWNALTLQQPTYPATLVFRHYGLLDGALWTIRWEFACYLLVAVMGIMGGGMRRRWPWIALFLLCAPVVALHDRAARTVGTDALGVAAPRFALVFAAGALFYLYRERIAYTRPLAIVAGLVLVLAATRMATAQVAVATAGAYLLFAAAFARNKVTEGVGTKNDASYGLYLYAWPIQQLLILHAPGVPLAGQIALTLALALGAGFASYRLVERPMMRLKPKPRETPVSGTPT